MTSNKRYDFEERQEITSALVDEIAIAAVTLGEEIKQLRKYRDLAHEASKQLQEIKLKNKDLEASVDALSQMVEQEMLQHSLTKKDKQIFQEEIESLTEVIKRLIKE